MKHPEMSDILRKYTKGEITLEEANAALEDAGATFRLAPGQHELTAEDLAETTGGECAEEANGWGLLDTGTGSMEKVEVVDGKLAEAINQVQADGSTNMAAYVLIGGKRYEVKGDTLADC